MDITGKDICELEIPKDKRYVENDIDDGCSLFQTQLTPSKRITFEDTQNKKTVESVKRNVLSYYMPNTPKFPLKTKNKEREDRQKMAFEYS